MSWIHTRPCSFSGGSFPVLICGYLLFHHSPQWAPKYHIAESTTTVLANCSKKGRVELCVMTSHIRKKSVRKLLSIHYVRIFPFPHGPRWAPKCHFAESTTTVLASCSKKENLQLCVMKSHIRKQSHRKLHASYYLRIFPFSPWAPMGSQLSPCRFHENSVRKLLPEFYVVTLWNEFTDQKEDSQKVSLTFWTDDISFNSVGLNKIQRSPSQFPQRQC